MKKLLVATLLIAGSSVALFSCNNGAYDADPKTDLSSGKNPLDPGSGVNVYLGSMKGHVNRKVMTFHNAKYQIDTGGTRVIVANAIDDPELRRRFLITVPEVDYSNASVAYTKSFVIGGESYSWNFIYAVRDTTRKDRNLDFLYISNTASGSGQVLFQVAGDEGGNMRGKFKGTVFKAILNEDGVTPSGQFDLSDSVVFNDVEFYIPKGKIW
jgi:hypothetical protein